MSVLTSFKFGLKLRSQYRIANFSKVTNTIASKKWSYVHTPGTDSFRNETVGEIVDRAAELYGTKEALVFCQDNVRKNFIQLKQDVEKFAAGLIAIGLKQNDRLGIWSPNFYEWIITQYAAAKAGLILVNINPAYQARELEYSMEKVGIRALVIPEKFKTQNYYEMIKAVTPSIETSTPGNIKDKLQDFTHLIIMSDKQFGGAFKFIDVMNAGQNNHYEELKNLEQKIQFDDPVNIQFTSGTTGRAKATTLTHFNIVNNCYIVGKNLGFNEEGVRLCNPLPLFHCFGSVCGSLQSLVYGACQIYPAPHFCPKATAEAVQNEKCTYIYGTTTMYIALCNLENFNDYNFAPLKRAVSGGASCPPETLKFISEKLDLKTITSNYGCTETSPGITYPDADDSIEIRAYKVGKPFDHTEIKIVDTETNHILPLDKPGEVWVRGYLVMRGYWNDSEATDKAITKDGWYKTGDLGVIDQNGYLTLIGRIKDMVIRGGENIFPKEIEDFLHTHPKIAEAQIVGIPDETMGEELCAWVRLKPNENLVEEDVREFCKGQLSHFKIPRFIKIVEKFPLTTSGKVQKFVLRKMAADE